MSLLQGLVGIAKYGYCGQDFEYHYKQLLEFPSGFSYSATNPPGIYALGHAIAVLVSADFVLELTALCLLIANTLSLWLFHVLLERWIARPELRIAALLILAFVPFRVVHAIVFSADAATVPIFVAIAWCATELFERPAAAVRYWIAIALLVAIGLLFKYTFVGLIPGLALFALYSLRFARAESSRTGLIVATTCALVLPSAVFAAQFELSRRENGVAAVKQWRAPGAAREMEMRDILSLKAADVKLLRAPQYFQDTLYEPHRYSYPGLLHVAMFTDALNYFQQAPTLAGHFATHTRPTLGPTIGLPRRDLAARLSPLAVVASLPISVAALVGTVVFTIGSLRRLLANTGNTSLSLCTVTILAVGFYATIVLNITNVQHPYVGGYWLPRLVMPALLTFLVLGVVTLDRWADRLAAGTSARVSRLCLAYATLLSILYIVIT